MTFKNTILPCLVFNHEKCGVQFEMTFLCAGCKCSHENMHPTSTMRATTMRNTHFHVHWKNPRTRKIKYLSF